MLESDVIDDVKTALNLFGVFYWRNNTGVRAGVRFGMPGSPDFVCILRGGLFLGVECKSENGKQSMDQKTFQRRCEELGALYVVVRSGAELIRFFYKLAQDSKSNKNCEQVKFLDLAEQVEP